MHSICRYMTNLGPLQTLQYKLRGHLTTKINFEYITVEGIQSRLRMQTKLIGFDQRNCTSRAKGFHMQYCFGKRWIKDKCRTVLIKVLHSFLQRNRHFQPSNAFYPILTFTFPEIHLNFYFASREIDTMNLPMQIIQLFSRSNFQSKGILSF